MSQPRKPASPNLYKWIGLSLLAALFLLAASGVCVRPVGEVPTGWLIGAWCLAFAWVFFLDYLEVLSRPDRSLFVLGSTVGFDLLAQSTGGDQSPLSLAVFILMGVVTWNGGAKFGFWVAILFSLLEAVSLRNVSGDHPIALYLRWAALLVSAFFLARVVKTRDEKERLGHALESLKREAGNLAGSEPSSFQDPGENPLREESRFSARVGTVMGLEESLRRQVSLFQQTLPLHTVAVFLLTPLQDRKVFRLRAASSDSDSLARDITLSPGESLVGLAAKEGKRIFLNEMPAESAKALPYYLRSVPVASFLAQPLFTVGTEPELAGIVVFDSLARSFFKERELGLVDGFCALLEEALENVKTLHFSRTESRNLQALYGISKDLSHYMETENIVRKALAAAADIFPFDSLYIAMPAGEEEERKVFRVVDGVFKEGVPRPVCLEPEWAAWVLENKKPIRYSRGQKERPLKEGMMGSTQSFLMVPLLSADEVLGVIRLNSRSQQAYREQDQDLLSTLANQTAMALHSAIMVEQIRTMADRDGLTGVYNRRYFQEKLEEEIARAERHNKDLGFLLLDVDHFKKFNDTYGHQEGDQVLKTVANLVETALRQKVDTLARYGGEEFAVILPETGAHSARETGERIRRTIEAHLFQKEGKGLYRVTVSIGVSAYPFDARGSAKLIQAADQGLYESKKRGRNCVTLFQSIGKNLL